MKFFNKKQMTTEEKTYDADGYDKEGYDKNGYDRYGYNKEGLDKNGFNKEGYDYEGYNRQGYNKEGYDREGLDLYGFNKEGYDHLGYDRFGYNKEGYDRYDYDKYGYNKEGYDAHGYDKEGFNKEGFNKDGKTKEELQFIPIKKNIYKNNGYNELGFNPRGFTKEGIHKNGTLYDDNGYDKEGYDKDGFNRLGYTKDGVSRLNLKKKEEFEKYVKEYIGKTVYHENYGKGKIISIKPKDDFQSGYAKIEFERTTTREFQFPECIGNFIADTNIWNKNEEEMTYYDKEYKKEKRYLNQVLSYTNTQIEKEYKAPLLVRDTSWNNPYDEDYDPQETEDTFYTKSMRKYWNTLSLSPFFASIASKRDGLIYIGKEPISTLVYDWRSKEASPYYMYTSLLQSEDYGISLVRNHTIEYKRYKGFIDIYNKNSKDTILEKNSSDEYLTKLLNESRISKVTHDIIVSIQNLQYEIIQNETQENLLINGCAGSGKTMILYHKIAYNAFNQKNFNPKQICVISSNLLLKREGDILAKDLKINEIYNFDLHHFYKTILSFVAKKYNSFYPLRNMDGIKKNTSLYQKEVLEGYKSSFQSFLKNKEDISTLILKRINRNLNSILDKDIPIDSLEEIDSILNTSSYEEALSLFSKIPLINVIESKKLEKNFESFLTKNFSSYFKDTIEYTSKGEVKKKDYSYEREFKEFIQKCNTKRKTSLYNPELKNVSTFIDLYDYLALKKEIKNIKEYQEGNIKSYYYILADLFIQEFHLSLSNLDYEFLLIYLTKEQYKKDYPFLVSLYIDEYQNYSKEEFDLLKDIYDYSTFNFFGDLRQRIEASGIKDIKEIPFKIKKYDLNINYRNAKEICEYLNHKFDTNMVSIGVKGKVEEQPKSIELTLDEEGDRTALIVKDFTFTKELKAKGKVKLIDLKREDHIEKDIINILFIDDVKGLEFEKVYVYEKGMTEDEKYLASSRALRHLCIIKE